MPINQWPLAERPREKLLIRGAHALSDAELLAIFLRTGTRGKSAVDVARELLNDFQGLRPLLEASQTEFCKAQGLGSAKFAQLQAVLEMARRHLAEQLATPQELNDSRTVKAFLTAQLRHLKHEVFAVLFLDTQHRLITFEQLFEGTLDSASIYPREVVKKALSLNASAVILAHNHPSGDTSPSQADIHITQRIKQAMNLIDVTTLDHMIVGEGEALSFCEQGLL